MKKEILYTYLGTNGTLTTPIHLPDIYSVIHYRLTPDFQKKLTKDGTTFTSMIVVPEEELDKWYEVPLEGQN